MNQSEILCDKCGTKLISKGEEAVDDMLFELGIPY